MNTWDKQRNNENYKIKLQKVKSTMKKCILKFNIQVAANGTLVKKKSQSTNTKKKNPEQLNFMKLYRNKDVCDDYEDHRKGHETQPFLKRLLREFGLQQYLRVKLNITI
jgi:hypothetical protein